MNSYKLKQNLNLKLQINNRLYCFKCGEDGHIAQSCSNDPNPALVAEKKRQYLERECENGDHHTIQPTRLVGRAAFVRTWPE